MAGDKVRRTDQIWRADGPRAKAEVRDGGGTGFLRVVNKVALGIVVRFFADDLDRILVRSHRAIGSQAEKHGTNNIVRFDVESIVIRERKMGHVIDDANGEMLPWPL